MKAVISLLMAYLLTLTAFGQWPTNPGQRLAISNGSAVKTVADGQGGVFAAFVSSTGPMQSSCYLQKLDLYGYPVLPAPVYLNSGNGIYVDDFHCLTDGTGGVIVAVLERCLAEPDWYWRISIYRFNREGESIYWNVSVNSIEQVVPQDYLATAPDSLGGLYLAYMDTLDFRVQHLSPTGEQLWGDNGLSLAVGSAYPQPYDLTMGADAQACFVTVRGNDLRAFKFTPEGDFVWGEAGLAINDLGEDQELAPDGTGGLVEICREPNQNQLIAYRLDSQGNWTWSQNGVLLGTMHWDKSVLCHYPFCYIVWLASNSPFQARLQKLDYLGNIQWLEDLVLFPGLEIQDDPAMTDADGSGLVVVCRLSTGLSANVYAQKYSYDGEKLWDEAGVPLTNRGYTSSSLGVVTNGSGGGIFSWSEIDPVQGQLACAALVSSEGDLGEVLGVIAPPTPNLPTALTLELYPNPANATFTISYQLNRPGEVRLGLYNLTGQLVWSNHLKNQLPGDYQLTLTNESLPSGNYLLQLENEERRCAKNLIILK